MFTLRCLINEGVIKNGRVGDFVKFNKRVGSKHIKINEERGSEFQKTVNIGNE